MKRTKEYKKLYEEYEKINEEKTYNLNPSELLPFLPKIKIYSECNDELSDIELYVDCDIDIGLIAKKALGKNKDYQEYVLEIKQYYQKLYSFAKKYNITVSQLLKDFDDYCSIRNDSKGYKESIKVKLEQLDLPKSKIERLIKEACK